MLDLNFFSWLGKQAAAAGRTVRAGTHRVDTPEGRAAAAAALKAELRPAGHVPPTRYGRTPYRRTTGKED